MKGKLLFFKLFILAALVIPVSAFAEIKDDDVAKIDELIKTGKYIVIDVRTKEEYNAGHLAGALNFDYYSDDFEDSIESQFKNKNKPYIVYCRSGKRSLASAEILEELGFTNVTNMKGGILAWESAGKPVVKQVYNNLGLFLEGNMGYEKLKEVTVLYVEDEDMMRESVVMLLKRRFKQVFVAANGLEAVNIYKAEHPDVVITDLQMPVMDGMELARQIRALGNTPIVVVSAFNDNSHQVPEANSMLLKPIRKNDLFDTVMDCISV